jgi:pimeloyl-ACP methyl ester carboxylesterase
VYGRENGYPILGCHGLAGSVYTDGLDEHTPIKYILIARPGYGKSDFWLMENISEWPEIIEPFLNYLRIDSFDVVGISAGAPYAYAAAVHYPDRVKNVFINKGLGAIYRPDIIALYPNEIEKELSIYQKGTLKEIADTIQKTYVAVLTEEQKQIPYIRDSLVGACMGMAACGKLEFMSDWGFHIEDVKQPVYLYHCRDDQEVPFAIAEKTASYLPNAKMFVRDTGGHMSSELMKDMMDKIIELYFPPKNI